VCFYWNFIREPNDALAGKWILGFRKWREEKEEKRRRTMRTGLLANQLMWDEFPGPNVWSEVDTQIDLYVCMWICARDKERGRRGDFDGVEESLPQPKE
jgi:hypothetical protein